MDTELAKRMIERADKDNLPHDHVVRLAAKDFEDSAAGYWSEPQSKTVKQFLGAWARAKMAWRDYTGEQLL